MLTTCTTNQIIMEQPIKIHWIIIFNIVQKCCDIMYIDLHQGTVLQSSCCLRIQEIGTFQTYVHHFVARAITLQFSSEIGVISIWPSLPYDIFSLQAMIEAIKHSIVMLQISKVLVLFSQKLVKKEGGLKKLVKGGKPELCTLRSCKRLLRTECFL